MPLLDRDCKITYGSLVMGGPAGGTNYHLAGKLDLQIGWASGSAEFDVVVQGDTHATFTTRETALKAAFRIPFQRLLIELGASERFDFDPSDNSGFNQNPSISKVAGDEDTALSARYRCRVDFGLPADASGRNSRQDSRITLSYGDGRRRRVEISGTYTATSTPTAARAQYEAQDDTYCDSITAAIDNTATWKLIGEPRVTTDDQNKTCTFTRVYEEEFSTMPQHAALRGQVLDMDVEESSASGGASDASAQPPYEITVRYRGGVDNTSTTDLATMWTGTILPAIKSRITAVVGAYTLVEATPTYHWASNQISGLVRARSYATSILSQRTEIEESYNHARQFVPIADGEDFTYRLYEGPRSKSRIVTRQTMRRANKGSHVDGNVLGLAVDISTSPGGFRLGIQSHVDGALTAITAPAGWHILSELVRKVHVYDGLPGDQEEIEGIVEVVPMIRADVKEPE